MTDIGLIITFLIWIANTVSWHEEQHYPEKIHDYLFGELSYDDARISSAEMLLSSLSSPINDLTAQFTGITSSPPSEIVQCRSGPRGCCDQARHPHAQKRQGEPQGQASEATPFLLRMLKHESPQHAQSSIYTYAQTRIITCFINTIPTIQYLTTINTASINRTVCSITLSFI